MKKPKSYSPKKSGKKKFNLKNKERSFRQSLYQTKEWKEFRFRFLAKNKYCYCCNASSDTVDHIITHKGKIDVFFDAHNMMPMCKPCHDYVTGKFDSHKEQKIKEKAEWILEQRKLYNIKRPIYYVPIKKFIPKT